MRALTTIFILFIFASCDMELDLVESENKYVIQEGEHISTSSFKGFDGSILSFEAKFNETAIYKTVDEANQADINKLMGFSTCESHHHQNSARIGWRWYNEKLEILAYAYVDGIRKEEYITTVPLNDYVSYEISVQPDGYHFRAGDVKKVIQAETTCTEGGNYMLWPYFGGDETAPHEIVIFIDSIEQTSGSGAEYKTGG